MSNPAANKRKGAKFETDLVKALREEGYDAERLHLNGCDDEGDVVVRFHLGTRLVIEAKSGELHPTQHMREAETEGANYARNRGIHDFDMVTAVFGKLPRQPILDGYAMVRIRDLMEWLRVYDSES